MKIESHHWRHYFGGVSVLLILVQLLSGLFLTMFYVPGLEEAYASIKFLYDDLASWSWLRDTHRWNALFFFVAIVIHTVRSTLRGEFLHPNKKTLWLTGSLLLLPMLLFLLTGLILPWDWKGYWIMEMVPNYAGAVPVVGPLLKESLITAFTIPRALVAHVVVLPIVTMILIDLHCLTKLRKRGIFTYIAKHLLIAAPFLALLFALAVYIPMPTQDPEIIPLPFDGVNIPTPEWFLLILLLPFMYFKGSTAVTLGLYLPVLIFFVLCFAPYLFGANKGRASAAARIAKNRGNEELDKRSSVVKMAGALVLVPLTLALLLGGLSWGTHRSPTMGCSSCHNAYSGVRMGIPPSAFKDRKIVPLLDDNEWMLRHWFDPQVVW
jgi:quinol-cytochrome oxidoreductase complex cytochrome b subunit